MTGPPGYLISQRRSDELDRLIQENPRPRVNTLPGSAQSRARQVEVVYVEDRYGSTDYYSGWVVLENTAGRVDLPAYIDIRHVNLGETLTPGDYYIGVRAGDRASTGKPLFLVQEPGGGGGTSYDAGCHIDATALASGTISVDISSIIQSNSGLTTFTEEGCDYLRLDLGCGLEIDPSGAVAVDPDDIAGQGLTPVGGSSCAITVDLGCGLEFDLSNAVQVAIADLLATDAGFEIFSGVGCDRLAVNVGCGLTITPESDPGKFGKVEFARSDVMGDGLAADGVGCAIRWDSPSTAGAGIEDDGANNHRIDQDYVNVTLGDWVDNIGVTLSGDDLEILTNFRPVTYRQNPGNAVIGFDFGTPDDDLQTVDLSPILGVDIYHDGVLILANSRRIDFIGNCFIVTDDLAGGVTVEYDCENCCAGVEIACCPGVELPTTLFMTWSDGGQVVELTWNGSGWASGEIELYACGSINILFSCSGIGDVFGPQDCSVVTVDLSDTLVCDPFSYTAEVSVSGPGCGCSTNYAIAIGATAPAEPAHPGGGGGGPPPPPGP